jgi:predicted signal transduction protein with EAL and GGDEF domain
VTLLGLTTDQATLWWIALAIGLVVVAVVIVLLTLLSRFLSDVASGVAALQDVAEQIERVAPSDDLPATAASLRELGAEIQLQDDLLTRLTRR